MNLFICYARLVSTSHHKHAFHGCVRASLSDDDCSLQVWPKPTSSSPSSFVGEYGGLGPTRKKILPLLTDDPKSLHSTFVVLDFHVPAPTADHSSNPLSFYCIQTQNFLTMHIHFLLLSSRRAPKRGPPCSAAPKTPKKSFLTNHSHSRSPPRNSRTHARKRFNPAPNRTYFRFNRNKIHALDDRKEQSEIRQRWWLFHQQKKYDGAVRSVAGLVGQRRRDEWRSASRASEME